MSIHTRDNFTTVRSEGAILPPDMLRRITDEDAAQHGLHPADYHREGERLNEAISRAWNRLLGVWKAFREAMEKLPAGDAGTSITRELWLLKLFQELDYGRLQTARAIEIGERTYAVSHLWGNAPIHLVGCRVDLDKRTAGVRGAARSSPHSLLQELLNASDEHVWGFVSNGLQLRVLRDNASLTRQAYVEFDLEALFDGQVYPDFILLWLICHQSRVEGERADQCWLERWSRAAQEQGTRALDQLRDGVQRAIEALGRGFLAHQANMALRERLRSGELSTQDYYRQLLRLVYRLLFLFVAEDRALLLDPTADAVARDRYTRFYALDRLRRLAERRLGTRHGDLFQGLLLVMRQLGSDMGCPALGLPALGSFLFSDQALPDLEACAITNHDLLDAIRALALISDRHGRRLVDYQNLGAEELGSVYESLLELHPELNADAATFALRAAGGSERKTTGSYYTPTGLITCLLDSALDPVLDEACRKPNPAQAILDLKICDPACGSGHFLIAAAHRLAKRLAAIRTGDEEPSPEATRTALRDVIGRCIYGVDINPMAVELCKVGLWMEALEPGKPLSFLDAHIRRGNSLIGAQRDLVDRGIPDEAFQPVTGDDKATAAAFRKRNAKERKAKESSQAMLPLDFGDERRLDIVVQAARRLNAMPDDSVKAVREKASAYEQLRLDERDTRTLYDLWTAAFFLPLTDPADPTIPTTQTLLNFKQRPAAAHSQMVRRATDFAQEIGFFHWELEFPHVFDEDGGGFDVVLGNPPWEQIELKEEEHWVDVPEIRDAPNKAARAKKIQEWRSSVDSARRARVALFDQAKYRAEAESRFVRASGRFPLTAVGRVNTYALFADHARALLAPVGRAGIIVPTGIATDDNYKLFFSDLIRAQSLVRLIGFENEDFIFPTVHHAFKFCALTMTGAELSNRFARFAFFCRYFNQIEQHERNFVLSNEDIFLINPNTYNCPIFRTSVDAELTKKIYHRVPVLLNELSKRNPWSVSFRQGLFNMAIDSGLFIGRPSSDLLPLYEAKMMWHFDHRFATHEGASEAQLNVGILPQPTATQKQDPKFRVIPRYWVQSSEVGERLAGRWQRQWFLGFRDVTNATNERTAIFSLLPYAGVGHTAPLIFADVSTVLTTCLLTCVNSLTLDYIARQKIGGMHLTFGLLYQLPVLPSTTFSADDFAFIVPRVLELVYTAWDMQPFAEDVWAELDEEGRKCVIARNAECNRDAPADLFAPRDGFPLPPFRWKEERRALIRAELDARIARLYSLTRDELRYILDPADVYGPDFPGETFRVLKEKEIKLYGEYRTRRLVLEAWDAAGY